MMTLLAFAALFAVTAGTATGLYTTWQRMNELRQEADRLRESLARKRPATISLQQAELTRRLEALQSDALALVRQVAPEVELSDPAACVAFLGRIFDDQRRANAEYQEQLDRACDELLRTRRRLEEARSTLNQVRIRRGSSEAQLAKLEEALAAVMADRDQLRWQLDALTADAQPLKLAS